MSKLLMLRGLPASGKSTRAKEMVATGNYVRVNRDDLRAMLHNNKWSGRNEDKTVAAEKAIVYRMLETGSCVVVDDTNLSAKHLKMWSDVALDAGATFEVERLETAVDECILRDITREKSVGRHVIVNMALQYGLYPVPANGFVLCDLDGTLCDVSHRLKYAKGPEKDWEKFFAGIADDPPHWKVVAMVKAWKQAGHEIIFVSARPENYRDVTEAWIGRIFDWERPHTTLIMRKSHDKREDSIVKQEMFDTFFKGKYPVATVIDDRPRVIEMWRKNGLEVIDVGPGIDF